MATVTIIVPTFDHQQTLNYSLASIQRQDFHDFEVVVIGDGSPQATEDIVLRFQQQDPRFTFVRYPKSLRTGEPYRDALIRNVDSKFIAYLGDDDLWLPWHLGQLVDALQNADFAHSPHILVNRSGCLSGFIANPQSPALRAKMTDIRLQCFGPTFVAHTREAYLRLEKGWESTPEGYNTDVYMWAKWVRDSSVRFKMARYPSALHFHSVIRPFHTLDERAKELKDWSGRIAAYGCPTDLSNTVSYIDHFSRVLTGSTLKSLVSLDDVLAFHRLDRSNQTWLDKFRWRRKPDLQKLVLNKIQYKGLALAWAQFRGTVTPQQSLKRWKALFIEAPDHLEHRFMLLRALADSGQYDSMDTYLSSDSCGVEELIDLTHWFRRRQTLNLEVAVRLKRSLDLQNAPVDMMVMFADEAIAAGLNDFSAQVLTETDERYPGHEYVLSRLARLKQCDVGDRCRSDVGLEKKC